MRAPKRPAAPAMPPQAPQAAEPNDQTHCLRLALLSAVRDPSRPDLSLRQLGILLITLSASEPPTIRGLAAKLHIPKASVSRSVDKLEELGLAERVPDRADRRSVRVRVTQEGAAMAARFGAAYAAAASSKR